MSEDKKERARARRIDTARDLEQRGHVDHAVKEYLRAKVPAEAARVLAMKGRLADAGKAILEGLKIQPGEAGTLSANDRELAKQAAVFFEQGNDPSSAQKLRDVLAAAGPPDPSVEDRALPMPSADGAGSTTPPPRPSAAPSVGRSATGRPSPAVSPDDVATTPGLHRSPSTRPGAGPRRLDADAVVASASTEAATSPGLHQSDFVAPGAGPRKKLDSGALDVPPEIATGSLRSPLRPPSAESGSFRPPATPSFRAPGGATPSFRAPGPAATGTGSFRSPLTRREPSVEILGEPQLRKPSSGERAPVAPEVRRPASGEHAPVAPEIRKPASGERAPVAPDIRRPASGERAPVAAAAEVRKPTSGERPPIEPSAPTPPPPPQQKLSASGEVVTEYAGKREDGWRNADSTTIDLSIREHLEAGRKGAAARIARDVGRFEQALEWFLELGLHTPAGACYRALGNYDLALEELLQEDDKGPNYRKACFELVPLATELKRLDFDVDRFLGQFIEEGPRDRDEVATYVELAELYVATSFPRGAQRCLRGVLAMDPSHEAAKALKRRIEQGEAVQDGRPKSILPAAARGLPPLPTLDEFRTLAREHIPEA